MSQSRSRIPEYLNKNAMFSRRVQIASDECVDVVLTRGPNIYLTNDYEVLAACDLTRTVLRQIECKPTDFVAGSQESTKLFDFDVCFSYGGNVRQIFILLKMRDKLVVMTKGHQHQLTVHQQYENVRLFKIDEHNSAVYLRIESMDGSFEYEDLYRLTSESPVVDRERFGGVASTIVDRIALVQAEVATTKLDLQKYFHMLAKDLRFGPNSLHDSVEERVMLAKFGDIWMKRHNDMLVIGIPVYNCCYLSKRLIENIRLTLLSDQLNHFDFTYKLYRFDIDETAAPNYDEILNKDDNFLFPSFEQEWQPSGNNNLLPDTAAIIVATTSIPDFVDFAVLEFDCFVEYDVHGDDDGQMNSLQNFMGKVSIASDIFYDAKYLVTFDRDNVYKDLLAVSSTSAVVFVKLSFIGMPAKESFYEFLSNHLEFTKTSELRAEQQDYMDNPEFLTAASNVHQQLHRHSNDIYFLSKENSYWNNTMVRSHCREALVDELKIYNKCKGKISSLMQTIRSRFDKITIQLVDPRCDPIKLAVLKHAVQNEMEFAKKTTTVVVDDSFVNEMLRLEFETDVACA